MTGMEEKQGKGSSVLQAREVLEERLSPPREALQPAAKRQLLLLARGLYPELLSVELCYLPSLFCQQHQNCRFLLPLLLPAAMTDYLSPAGLPQQAGSKAARSLW